MRPPGFWRRDAAPLAGRLLSPLSLPWIASGALRRWLVRPAEAAVPVICVGNLTLGGTGKTPAVRLLVDWFGARGVTAGVLSRGYGGRLSGRAPVLVDPAAHSAGDVGDEPLLHAGRGPTVICADRRAGAAQLAEMADVIIMDDGHQNPALVKDLSLLTADASEGFGNGRVVPAGPLREPVATGLLRANAIIAIGGGILDPRIARSGLPVLRGELRAEDAPDVAGRRVHGFAGIGDPVRFRRTLEELGAEIAGFDGFPDHHPYARADLERLRRRASAADAALVTTEKDAVRLPADVRSEVAILPVRLRLDAPDRLDALLDPVLAQVRRRASGGEPTNR
jgi:tetraacyldisaccharide 4'-kinase